MSTLWTVLTTINHVKHILGTGRANAKKASFWEVYIVKRVTTSAVSSGENVASHLTIHMNGETAMMKTWAIPLTKPASVSVKEKDILSPGLWHANPEGNCPASRSLNVAVCGMVSFYSTRHFLDNILFSNWIWMQRVLKWKSAEIKPWPFWYFCPRIFPDSIVNGINSTITRGNSNPFFNVRVACSAGVMLGRSS